IFNTPISNGPIMVDRMWNARNTALLKKSRGTQMECKWNACLTSGTQCHDVIHPDPGSDRNLTGSS
ncbi:Hypothetical predicted protein, partial [Pelobates cultripes]